jgi:hypothetical protein
MKLRHLMTAALGGLVLSCQGPAAVLAREAANGERPEGAGARPAEALKAAPRRIGA